MAPAEGGLEQDSEDRDDPTGTISSAEPSDRFSIISIVSAPLRSGGGGGIGTAGAAAAISAAIPTRLPLRERWSNDMEEGWRVCRPLIDGSTSGGGRYAFIEGDGAELSSTSVSPAATAAAASRCCCCSTYIGVGTNPAPAAAVGDAEEEEGIALPPPEAAGSRGANGDINETELLLRHEGPRVNAGLFAYRILTASFSSTAMSAGEGTGWNRGTGCCLM